MRSVPICFSSRRCSLRTGGGTNGRKVDGPEVVNAGRVRRQTWQQEPWRKCGSMPRKMHSQKPLRQTPWVKARRSSKKRRKDKPSLRILESLDLWGPDSKKLPRRSSQPSSRLRAPRLRRMRHAWREERGMLYAVLRSLRQELPKLLHDLTICKPFCAAALQDQSPAMKRRTTEKREMLETRTFLVAASQERARKIAMSGSLLGPPRPGCSTCRRRSSGKGWHLRSTAVS